MESYRLDSMQAEKWILVNGQIYKLYQDDLTLNEALDLAAILSAERHLLIKNSTHMKWCLYWKHKKQTLACPLP